MMSATEVARRVQFITFSQRGREAPDTADMNQNKRWTCMVAIQDSERRTNQVFPHQFRKVHLPKVVTSIIGVS